jgi:hypothetical protein
MIPGWVSKLTEATLASSASISPKTDVVTVTGTTQINTIIPALGTSQSQFLILIPKDGSIILGTSGNIAVGGTFVVNRAVFMAFVRSLGKWVINSGV